MLNVSLVNPLNKKALHIEEAYKPTVEVTGEEVTPVIMTGAQAHGTFTSGSRSSGGTTVLVSPKADGSLILTDLVLGTDKVNGATVTIQVTDGSQTEIVFATNVTDAPANLAIGFAGRWQGWKDARVELVTTGTVDATVSLGYIKVPGGLPYQEWDSLR
jgi:hypothetical protein